MPASSTRGPAGPAHRYADEVAAPSSTGSVTARPTAAGLVVIAAATASVVFIALVAGRGRGTDPGAAPPVPATTAAVTTSTVPGPPPVEVASTIADAGEIESVPVALHAGDELRVTVTVDDPEADDLDPVVGLTMPDATLVPEGFTGGAAGNPTSVFRGPYALLYGDTEAPAASVPVMAADARRGSDAEWLAFVAPAEATYQLVVRGHADTTGDYTLARQVRAGSTPARALARLAGHDDWIDRRGVLDLVDADIEWFTDRSFFTSADFSVEGTYRGPDAATVRARLEQP